METDIKDKTSIEAAGNQEKKTPMKSLVFDLRWHDAIQQIPQYDRAEMYEAICRYAQDGTGLNTSDPLKRMALQIIYDQIDDQRRVQAELKEM